MQRAMPESKTEVTKPSELRFPTLEANLDGGLRIPNPNRHRHSLPTSTRLGGPQGQTARRDLAQAQARPGRPGP
eukprot:6641691-Pyramimonas_sp.AAC.1